MGQGFKSLFTGNAKSYVDLNKVLDQQKKIQQNTVSENRTALATAKTNKAIAERDAKTANAN